MKLRSSSVIGNDGKVMNINSQRIVKTNKSLNMNLRSRSIREKEDDDIEFSTKSTTLRFRTTNVPVNEIRGQRTGVSQTTNKIANSTIVYG